MECLPVEKISEGDTWTYELKLDGYTDWQTALDPTRPQASI